MKHCHSHLDAVGAEGCKISLEWFSAPIADAEVEALLAGVDEDEVWDAENRRRQELADELIERLRQ